MSEPNQEPYIARELDLPSSHGFRMRGWEFSSQEVRDAIAGHRLLNPAVELGTNICPWNCAFCFTENPSNPTGRKLRLANELPIERRLRLIGELADLGCRSINFVGAGEPTIDPDFWSLLDAMRRRDITPIVYTEGSLRLQRRDFALRLFDSGATVVLKVNSLWNSEYQDALLRGIAPQPGIPRHSYTEARNRALDVLFQTGFANSVPTRLAFDTIVTKQNEHEIEELHRFTRLHNVFVLFVNYLPSGRSSDVQFDALSPSEQFALFARLAAIDRAEFRIDHSSHFPYAGGVPCTIRGLGLFITITGGVFDCPGELKSFGDLKSKSLDVIWNEARSITGAFNGGCLPRELFWRRQASAELLQNPSESSPPAHEESRSH